MTDSPRSPAFDHPLTARIAAFLDGIGIPVEPVRLSEPTFLPGIQLDTGRLLVDESRLDHPGDLLHEAGHIAVMTPERRACRHHDAGKNLGEEIGAIAWSWAALVHLGLPPEAVFHEHGYRGASQSFIENFSAGLCPGLPLLQWMGLTLDEGRARECGLPPFPHMLRWLRETPPSSKP